MLDSFFSQDIELQQWQSMLATMRGDNLSDSIEALQKDAWEEVRAFDYDDDFHFGNTYANLLLNAIVGEITEQLGDTVSTEIFINAMDTKFSVDGVAINSLNDLNRYLHGATGLNDFSTMILGLLNKYDATDSEILSELRSCGVDSVIGDYMPTQEILRDLDIDLNIDVDQMNIHLKWAIGAARIVKAIIEEHGASEELRNSVCIYLDGVKVIIYIDSGEWDSSSIETLEDLEDLLRLNLAE